MNTQWWPSSSCGVVDRGSDVLNWKYNKYAVVPTFGTVDRNYSRPRTRPQRYVCRYYKKNRFFFLFFTPRVVAPERSLSKLPQSVRLVITQCSPGKNSSCENTPRVSRRAPQRRLMMGYAARQTHNIIIILFPWFFNFIYVFILRSVHIHSVPPIRVRSFARHSPRSSNATALSSKVIITNFFFVTRVRYIFYGHLRRVLAFVPIHLERL